MKPNCVAPAEHFRWYFIARYETPLQVKRSKFLDFATVIKPEGPAFIIQWRRTCRATIKCCCMLNHSVLLQLDRTVHPINLMRMNHMVVLFLMVCNGLSADSIMAAALLTFLISLPCPTTIFNQRRGNHLRPIFNEEHHHRPIEV